MSRANDGQRMPRPDSGTLRLPNHGRQADKRRATEVHHAGTELPLRIASGLPENLIGQIGSQRDAKLFALISLNHEQDPKDHAEY
jgi:hypothetical protein